MCKTIIVVKANHFLGAEDENTRFRISAKPASYFHNCLAFHQLTQLFHFILITFYFVYNCIRNFIHLTWEKQKLNVHEIAIWIFYQSKDCCDVVNIRGGDEDTIFEGKNLKKIRSQSQGPTFRKETLLKPRIGMVKAKGKGTIFPNYDWQIFHDF